MWTSIKLPGEVTIMWTSIKLPKYTINFYMYNLLKPHALVVHRYIFHNLLGSPSCKACCGQECLNILHPPSTLKLSTATADHSAASK